jgi:hypothetical protein
MSEAVGMFQDIVNERGDGLRKLHFSISNNW